MKRLFRPHLTGKVVLPVVLLGALSVVITLYSMMHLHGVDRDYRVLLERDARASMLVGEALLDLSDASRLVFAVLTEQEEAKMRAAQLQLDAQQASFRHKVDLIQPLLHGPAPQMADIRQQEQEVFALAATIVDAAARWRGDRALNVIHRQFDPTLHALRANMDDMRDDIVAHFRDASARLHATTRTTLRNTALAFGAALAAIIGLSAWLSLTQISRPVKQLTQAMSRLSQRDYDHPIAHTARGDEVGEMARTLQVFRDTMQRADRLEREAAASAEARRLSQQLVDLTDAMPGAVFQLEMRPDGSQHFVFLSGKAGRFVGVQVPGPTASGLRLDDVRVARTPEGDAALAAAIEHSRWHLAPLDIDMQIGLDARTFWLKTLATARRTEGGGTLFNGVWLDISDIKAQAQALELAKEGAEQAARAKSAFLATMSHEIRTPMNAIIGLTQLSLRHPLDPGPRERLEKILRASRHLLGIINDILDFSKVDGGHLRPEAIAFAPGQLLDDIRAMFEEKAAGKGLTLRVASADALPVLVGDPLRISQILINYANNAIKFSERGAVSLRLALQREGDLSYLYGEVKDDGIGLSEAQIQGLFRPFQQADTSITRRFGGTGLGLAISRNLAELLGGGVGVRSEPGIGSTFWFRVRVEEADTGTAPSSGALPAPAVSPAALQGLRVLLVDDNELNRLVACEWLRDAGIHVEQARDGRHAIALLEQATVPGFDAVLMDMMMPELDGLSATRLLRRQARFAALPIIAMTANASREDVEQCLAAGMNAHVAKPIDEQQLWKALLVHCLPAQAGPEPVSPLPPPDDVPRGAAPGPTLDPGPLTRLRQLLPPARFAEVFAMLVDDCRQRAREARALAVDADPRDTLLHKQAHDLVGTAGHAGLKRLEALGHAVRHAMREGDAASARRLWGEIGVASDDAVEALARHVGKSDA